MSSVLKDAISIFQDYWMSESYSLEILYLEFQDYWS